MSVTSIVAPRLPSSPPDYNQRYNDELTNILRLYFKQIDSAIRGLNIAVSEPFGLLVAKGDVPGTTGLFKFGFNADVDTAEETIWDGGGLYAYPASALAMTIVSSSANDAAAGTGARTVTVIGLNASYVEITQTITLNGTTAVNIPTALIRVYRVFVVTAGSGNTAAGTLTIANAGTTYAQITLGDNQTLMAVYTVPAGYTLYMTAGSVSAGTANASQFITARLVQRQLGGVFRDVAKLTLQVGTASFDGVVVPLRFPEKTDIEIRAIATNNNNAIGGTFSGYLVAN